MPFSRRQLFSASALGLAATAVPAETAFAADTDFAAEATSKFGRRLPLIIDDQGTFSAGGSITRTPGTFDPRTPFAPQGQTLHGDHASVRYQIPLNPRRYPLVFLHGAGQSSRCWESTPDGRDGYQNIFLRRRYPVYLVDQPRRGQAGQSTVSTTIEAASRDQYYFTQFRLGLAPDYYPGVQVARDEESLNQLLRWGTPNTGPYDEEVISDAMAAVFQRSGPSVLVSHSQGGSPGWRTAIKSQQVQAIVAYEPIAFTFPEDDVPEPIPNSWGTFPGIPVPRQDFLRLTRIPIVIYYGDNIPERPSDIPAQDFWRASLQMARQWVEVVNRNGGDATIVHLPDEGIRGNTHFPFADLNNNEVADHMSGWLQDHHLR